MISYFKTGNLFMLFFYLVANDANVKIVRLANQYYLPDIIQVHN